MKKRSAIAVYLLLWVTCGFYLFYWIFSLIEEINSFKNEEVVSLKKRATGFVIAILLFTVIFGFLLYFFDSNNPFYGFFFIGCFCVGIYWFVLIIKTLREIGKEIQKIQQEQNIDKLVSIPLLTLLFFLYYFAVPYLQTHINKIAIGRKESIEHSKKALHITCLMVLIVIVGISIGGISIFTRVGLLPTNKKQKIEIANTINGSSNTKVNIPNPGKYDLWVVLDVKYKGPVNIILCIKISKNGEIFLSEKYNPFDSKLTINSKKITFINKTSSSFSGLLNTIDIPESGDYDIEVTTNFDENVESVTKSLIYLK
jgi:hypothetical protein